MYIGHHNIFLGDGQNWSGEIDIEVLENFGVCSLVHVPAELDVDSFMPWSTSQTHRPAPTCVRVSSNASRLVLQDLATQPDHESSQISRPIDSQRRLIRIEHPILKRPRGEVIKIEQRGIDQIWLRVRIIRLSRYGRQVVHNTS